MLKERLYGSDIRLVSGIMTMVEDLERLGDHAQDLMTFALKLKNSENHKNAEILAMAQFTMKMVDDSIKSYITKDVELAQDVIQRDDVVDHDYDKLLDYLVEAGKDRDVSSAFVVYTTLVVKYIERIADHSTNIAEWVVYIITGYYKDTQIL
jgi:phosphate transport system protein